MEESILEICLRFIKFYNKTSPIYTFKAKPNMAHIIIMRASKFNANAVSVLLSKGRQYCLIHINQDIAFVIRFNI